MHGSKWRCMRIDTLEQRLQLAVAAFEFNLFEDVNGVPGSAIEEIAVDDSFFVEITAQEYDPHANGLSGVALDIHWDPNALESLDAPFDPSQVITPDLPLLQTGELDQDNGQILDLGGSSFTSTNTGRNIGDDLPERFALLRFRTQQPGNTSLTLNQGWSRITNDLVARFHDSLIRFETQTVTVTAAAGGGSNLTLTPVGDIETVGLQVILREDNGGVPGASIETNTLEVNESFFAEIAAQDLRNAPEGISGLSVDVGWDTAVFEPLGQFDPGDSNSELVTSSFPLFRSGSLDTGAGSISDLRGSSFRSSGQGTPIGATGPEQFSLLHFRAVAPTEQTTFTVGVGQNGLGLVHDDTSGAATVSVQSPTIVVQDAAEPPQIAVTAVSGTGLDSIQFSTALPGGSSQFVRPAWPDDTQYVDLTNNGPSLLTIQEIQIHAPGVSVDLPLSSQPGDDLFLSPNETRRVRLTFAPTSPNSQDPLGQSFNVSNGLVILSDAENDPRLEIALAGQSTYDADITYDGRVNIADLARLDDHFGAHAGDENYSVAHDPNGDGAIDLGDFAPLNVEFGLALSASSQQIAAGPPSSLSAGPSAESLPVRDVVQNRAESLNTASLISQRQAATTSPTRSAADLFANESLPHSPAGAESLAGVDQAFAAIAEEPFTLRAVRRLQRDPLGVR